VCVCVCVLSGVVHSSDIVRSIAVTMYDVVDWYRHPRGDRRERENKEIRLRSSSMTERSIKRSLKAADTQTHAHTLVLVPSFFYFVIRTYQLIGIDNAKLEFGDASQPNSTVAKVLGLLRQASGPGLVCHDVVLELCLCLCRALLVLLACVGRQMYLFSTLQCSDRSIPTENTLPIGENVENRRKRE
jgi:hypothetical protein